MRQKQRYVNISPGPLVLNAMAGKGNELQKMYH